MLKKNKAKYDSVILEIFRNHNFENVKEFNFRREELSVVCEHLGIAKPKNLGDVLYSYRYRRPLPAEILERTPEGLEWLIEGTGKAEYVVRLTKMTRILPRSDLALIKIPDATPEIILANAMNDEQALLAKLRYNRLIDIFLGVTAYSLQNHLRTTIRQSVQIEIDEIYVGITKSGAQYIIPVQAKGGTDQLGSVQTRQDIMFAEEKYPNLICRTVSAQFIDKEKIAMFELDVEEDDIRIVEEKHYQLVSGHDISSKELSKYKSRTII